MSFGADTNILLDLLGGDLDARRAARRTLSQAVNTARVVVCPVVSAELGATFDDPLALDQFLTDL